MADINGQSRDRSLQLPHKRWHERSFVKAPLADLACGNLFVAKLAVVLVMACRWSELWLRWQCLDSHLLLAGADGHLPGGSGLRDMLDRAQDAWTAEGGEDLPLP